MDMRKEINLEELLKQNIGIRDDGYLEPMFVKTSVILSIMKEACKQTIELCSENAKVTGGGFYGKSGTIDERSILNTINQIV